jgi:murein L,D-transpeptidase YcbB/YkuD
MIFCKSEIDGCRTWTHSGQVSLRCVMPLRWKLGEEQVVSGTLSPWPVVQNGSNGHPIRTLQFLLRARGHNLIIDGIFGSVTEAAVKAFQSSNGVTPDGVVNPQTWSRLIIQVKKGISGDAVRSVQEEFQFRAGEPGKGLQVDGIFGPQTDSTVRAFQHALSLDIPSVIVDGIVGPITWQALVSGMLSG